jgi:hypothetical protein
LYSQAGQSSGEMYRQVGQSSGEMYTVKTGRTVQLGVGFIKVGLSLSSVEIYISVRHLVRHLGTVRRSSVEIYRPV